MKPFKDIHSCSGCTACFHSCPVNAISMVADMEGFYYPSIDSNKCTECGLCRKVCPFHKNYNTVGNFEIPLVYAVKHKDDVVRISSSSGGLFTAISDYVLNKNGVVYGAAFDEHFTVCHQKAENKVERGKFKGSKYVQSYLGNIFTDVKNELEKDRYVLFTGTPCQIAGIKACLSDKVYEKLILCDVVCLGTPSPLIWEEYVHFLVYKKKCDLQDFNFRNKESGWHSSQLYATMKDGTSGFNCPLVDSYDSLFHLHVVLRPSCHACVFTNFRRVSDITMADFWGIENSNPEFDDNKGVSLMLINTKKGAEVFENIKGAIEFAPSTVTDCKQRHLTKPAAKSPMRDIFWQEYHKYGFEYITKKYTDYGFINRIKHRVLKPLLNKLKLLNIVKSMIK